MAQTVRDALCILFDANPDDAQHTRAVFRMALDLAPALDSPANLSEITVAYYNAR